MLSSDETRLDEWYNHALSALRGEGFLGCSGHPPQWLLRPLSFFYLALALFTVTDNYQKGRFPFPLC